MRRGMVLKLNKDYALIATDDSDFLRVKFREGMRIGQKIFIFDEDIISSEEYEKTSSMPRYLKVVATLVACMAIAIIINNSLGRGPGPLYAMVSMDINPSFELGIDETYNVIEINAMNEDSKQILDSNLIGQPLSAVVSEILSDVEESGYALESDNALLISTVDFKNDDDESLQKAVADGVYLAMEKNKVYENTKVIFIEANEEDLKGAEEQKLSVGKYRLLEMSDNKIDKRTITKGRVSDLIKEEEIKDDLETDEDIKIIDGEDLQELKEMKEDIEHLKDTVEEVKGALNSDNFERVENLINHVEMMENKLMNKDSEFQEIREEIEALYRMIELEEVEDLDEFYEEDEDEELDEFYEDDEEWEDEELEGRHRMIELEEDEEIDESYEENEEMEDEEIDESYEENEEMEDEEIDESYEEDEEMEDEEIDESYEEDEEMEDEEIDESYEEDEEMEDEEIDESYEEDEEMEDEEIDESYEEDEEMEDEEIDESYEEDEEIEDEEIDESYEEDEEMGDEEIDESYEEDEEIEDEEIDESYEEDEEMEDEEIDESYEEDEEIEDEESEDSYEEDEEME